MKYRSRTDIVATILDAANGGSTKTHAPLSGSPVVNAGSTATADWDAAR